MRRSSVFSITTLMVLLFLLFTPLRVVLASCSRLGFNTNPGPPLNLPKDTPVAFSINSSASGRSGGYFIFSFENHQFTYPVKNTGGTTSVKIEPDVLYPSENPKEVKIYWSENILFGPADQLLCSDLYQIPKDATSYSCSISVTPPGPSITDTIYAETFVGDNIEYEVKLNPLGVGGAEIVGKGPFTGGQEVLLGSNFGVGGYEVIVQKTDLWGSDICKQTFYVTTEGGTQTGPKSLGKVCDFVPADKRSECQRCFVSEGGAWTAVGCISTKPEEFVKDFLRLGIGIAGGIAFLLILFGGFQILTSAGNPERLAGGKELVGAAISGLLLIIFSLFLLKVIGVDILGIPGFE